jgi:hypothetical protein
MSEYHQCQCQSIKFMSVSKSTLRDNESYEDIRVYFCIGYSRENLIENEAERKTVKVLEFLLLINTCHVFVHWIWKYTLTEKYILWFQKVNNLTVSTSLFNLKI